MKSSRMFLIWLVAAAWLFTGVNVQAQSNATAVVTLDIATGAANETD